jgi:N-formylglutamate deformylase
MAEVTSPPWLNVRRGNAPLLLCLPHTGTQIPAALVPSFRSAWLARRDTDWYVDRLYAFAEGLDASLVRTGISRSVIDPNRDPSGASLYPGQATTELCPTSTFDGEPLYRANLAPGAEEIASRRGDYFVPYHGAIAAEIARLRARHAHLVVYDCHSIRSQIPRLFSGLLPHLNLGTFSGASCAPVLSARIEALCEQSDFSHITNGRFKGGYTTRHYGRPLEGVHAVQMELACRAYLREPLGEVSEDNWPPPWDEAFATPLRLTLERVLTGCIEFASGGV